MRFRRRRFHERDIRRVLKATLPYWLPKQTGDRTESANAAYLTNVIIERLGDPNWNRPPKGYKTLV